MVQLRLGDNLIKVAQEIFFEMEIINKNEVGGLSSYAVDSNGNAEPATLNVSNCFLDIKTIESHGLEDAFYHCTGLTGSVSFPNLTSVGDSGLNCAFCECTGLTGSVSFPNLISVGYYGLNNAFYKCTGLTELHFRADAQSVIEAQPTYSSKFGATNATIYFDL